MLKKRDDIALFDPLFKPKGIALIGASDKPMKGATGFFHALLSAGFPRLYPVSPFFSELNGLTCYRKASDIPHEVDLAVIGVPRKLVPDTVQDCINKGIKFAHIFTAGFSETGSAEGIELEEKIRRIARGRIRIIGPNCMGIHCPASGIKWAKVHQTITGDVAFVSQSGGHAGHFIELTNEKKIGISKVVSVGNAVDLKVAELIEYLLLDPETGMIGLYIEGFDDNEGKIFFNTVKRIGSHKPMVVWKAGRTRSGARAVNSHTASIAGSYDIFKSAADQLGIQVVSSTEEMVDLIQGLKTLPLPQGPRVGILGIGGGQGVFISDTLASSGLEIPILEEETQRKITAITTESGTMVKNPVDPGAAVIRPENINALLRLLVNDRHVDAVLFHQNVNLINLWKKRGAFIEPDQAKQALIDAVADVIKDSEKPILCSFTRRSTRPEVYQQLSSMQETARRKNIEIYSSVEKAGKVICGLVRQQRLLNRF